MYPSWKRVFEDKSKEAMIAVYSDPAFRNQWREELKNPLGVSDELTEGRNDRGVGCGHSDANTYTTKQGNVRI